MVFTYPNQGYIATNTIQASGADLALTNRVISYGNPLVPICLFNDLVASSVTTGVAEQLQVTTLTPVAAANSTYTFYINQVDPATGNNYVGQYSYTTAASGDTATTICDYFRTLIAADQNLHVAGSGTTTLILTAETGYASFIVTLTSLGGGLTQSTGTTGIQAVGTTAALQAQGITEGISSSATYTTVVMKWYPKTGADITALVGATQTLTIYLNEAASNFSTLAAKFRYLLAGRSVSITSAANAEINDFGT